MCIKNDKDVFIFFEKTCFLLAVLLSFILTESCQENTKLKAAGSGWRTYKRLLLYSFLTAERDILQWCEGTIYEFRHFRKEEMNRKSEMIAKRKLRVHI